MIYLVVTGGYGCLRGPGIVASCKVCIAKEELVSRVCADFVSSNATSLYHGERRLRWGSRVVKSRISTLVASPTINPPICAM